MIKKVDAAIAAGDKAAAQASLLVAISEIDKAASKGVYHKNTASRKVCPSYQGCKRYRLVFKHKPNKGLHRIPVGMVCRQGFFSQENSSYEIKKRSAGIDPFSFYI